MSKAYDYHLPVLKRQVIEALQIRPDGVYYDATCGGGGHSAAILGQLSDQGLLISCDRDAMALNHASKLFSELSPEGRYHFHQAKFSEFSDVLAEEELSKLDGVLLDLGVSSYQLDAPERGFSYTQAGPLDMRMNQDQGMTAADYLAAVSEDDLAETLSRYGEERYSGRIAHAIIRRREQEPFTDTEDLADTIVRAMPASSRREKQHPAKRSFQAIRIVVNNELGELEGFLDKIPAYLAPGGRVCIITFHSLEDRIVKDCMRKWENPCTCPPKLPCVCGKKPLGFSVSRKGVVATEEEIEENPRARSARLRVFERFTDASGDERRG